MREKCFLDTLGDDRSIAISRMPLARLESFGGARIGVGHALLASVPASSRSAEDIERGILLQELLDTLTREERHICAWKAGFSSQQIARHQHRTVIAVDTIFSRAKQKLQRTCPAYAQRSADACSHDAALKPQSRDERGREIDDSTSKSHPPGGKPVRFGR